MGVKEDLLKRRRDLLEEKKELTWRIENQLEIAKETYDLIFHKKFSSAGAWLDRTKKVGRRDKLITNLLGGVRHLYAHLHPERHVQSAMDRRGPNSSIQGPSSDLGFVGGYMLRKLIWEWFESRDVMIGCRPCNSVHDSVYLEVPPINIPLVNYLCEHAYCQTGDTLVPTENGLLRLDEMVADDQIGKLQMLNTKVGSRYAPAIAKYGVYQGIRPVFRISTSTGNYLKCTANHKNLVFTDGELKWVRASDCKVGDFLCINPVQILRKKRLALNLELPVCTTKHRVDCKIPTHMTPKLAWLLAAITAEGTLTEINGNYQISFVNTNKSLINRFAEYTYAVFGIKVRPNWIKGLMGTQGTTKKDFGTFRINSKKLMMVMRELGMYIQTGRRNGKTASYYKDVPWSILQADGDSQAAFLSAYLECDGTIVKSKITFYSRSNKILRKLQIILNSMGAFPKKGKYRVSLEYLDAALVWKRIHKYAVSKRLVCKTSKRVAHGVPNGFWKKLLQDRRYNPHEIRGVFREYTDDNGNVITVGYDNSYLLNRQDKFLYASYDAGVYDKLLEQIRMISDSAHKKLIAMFKLRYKYTPITRITPIGDRKVYDLCMDSSVEPAFISNGIVVHNSTMLHRWIRDVMHYETNTSFEMDCAVGPCLSEMNDGTRWDAQVEAIRKGLEWKRDNLGSKQPIDKIMTIVEQNALIIFKLRRKEIKKQLEENTSVSYEMGMNRGNALEMGLIFKSPSIKSKVESASEATRRELA